MEGHGNDGSVRTRRQFTVEMAMALLGGAAVTIGCGGGASPTGPAPVAPTPSATPVPPPADFKLGTVSNNHGHEALITNAQLVAGGALRLDITGGAAHPHTVELSADEVVRVRTGERLTKQSSEDVGLFGPHQHVIQFN